MLMGSSSILLLTEKIFSNFYLQLLLVIIVTIVLNFLVPHFADLISWSLVQGRGFNKIDKKKYHRTISSLIKTTLSIALWFLTIAIILNILKIDIAPIIAGAGIFGAIIGFGAQNLIKDVIAGFFIILDNQYRVDDFITLYPSGKKISGKVETISFRVTKLRDMSGKLHIIRNDLSQAITNHTFEYSKINLNLNIGYDSDIDLVEKIINKVGKKIAEDENHKGQIIEPIKFLRITDFADSAIIIKVIGKVQAGKHFAIQGKFRRLIKKEFDKNNIDMPLPQLVIHQK